MSWTFYFALLIVQNGVKFQFKKMGDCRFYQRRLLNGVNFNLLNICSWSLLFNFGLIDWNVYPNCLSFSFSKVFCNLITFVCEETKHSNTTTFKIQIFFFFFFSVLHSRLGTLHDFHSCLQPTTVTFSGVMIKTVVKHCTRCVRHRLFKSICVDKGLFDNLLFVWDSVTSYAQYRSCNDFSCEKPSSSPKIL